MIEVFFAVFFWLGLGSSIAAFSLGLADKTMKQESTTDLIIASIFWPIFVWAPLSVLLWSYGQRAAEWMKYR